MTGSQPAHWNGRRVWIIGASAGIGAALARALAAQGAQLVLSARDEGALQRLAKDCGGATVLPVDLAERTSLPAAVANLAPATLDAVICTAAAYDPAPVAQADPAKAETMVRVNLLGTFDVAQQVPALLREGGQLVLFGSVAGYLGLPGGQIYSATKAGVNNLTESLRVELAPRVDVRLVCPGFVETQLTAKNSFDMPAMITPEAAAQATLRGMQGRHFEIHYPRRFTLLLKLLRALPYGLSLRITRRLR